MRQPVFLLAAGMTAVPVVADATVIVAAPYEAGATSAAGNFSLGPGTYEFRLSFTTPAIVSGFVEKQTVTNVFCVDPEIGPDEFACGGDEVPTQPLFEPVTSSLYHARLAVAPPSNFTFPPGSIVVRGVTFDDCCTYAFDFDADRPGLFTLSFEAVPEPTTWACLLIGLGGLGTITRSRRAFGRAQSMRDHRTTVLPQPM